MDVFYYCEYVEENGAFVGSYGRIQEGIDVFTSKDGRNISFMNTIRAMLDGVEKRYDDVLLVYKDSVKWWADDWKGTLVDREKENQLKIYSLNAGVQFTKGNTFTEKEVKAIQEGDEKAILSAAITALTADIGPLGDFVKKDDGNYYCESFVFDEIAFMDKWIKAAKMVEAFDAAHQEGTNEAHERFIKAANDLMDNVIVVNEWQNLIDGVQTSYVPINIFGALALQLIDDVKKDMGYYKCEICGTQIHVKRSAKKICAKCDGQIRARKKRIMKDFAEGKTIEQVEKSRRTSTLTEIVAYYEEFKNK